MIANSMQIGYFWEFGGSSCSQLINDFLFLDYIYITCNLCTSYEKVEKHNVFKNKINKSYVLALVRKGNWLIEVWFSIKISSFMGRNNYNLFRVTSRFPIILCSKSMFKVGTVFVVIVAVVGMYMTFSRTHFCRQ